LIFLNIQIDLIILKTYDQQFTLTTKNSLHIIFKIYVGDTTNFEATRFCPTLSLAVDASDMAIGAVLIQEVDGIEHPICYYSKKLNCHQKRYSTMEKEVLGLILAVRTLGHLQSVCTPIIARCISYGRCPPITRSCSFGVWSWTSTRARQNWWL